MEEKRRKSSDSGTYKIRPARVSTKSFGNGMSVGYNTSRNSNLTSRNGPTSLVEDRKQSTQTGREVVRNGVTTDGSASKSNDVSTVTKSVKTVKSGGTTKPGGTQKAAVWQAGSRGLSQESPSSRPPTPKHVSSHITVNSVQRKEKRTMSPSSISSGSDDTISRNSRPSSLRKKSSKGTTPGRPSPESTPVAERSNSRGSSPLQTRAVKSSCEQVGQLNKTVKPSPYKSGTNNSATKRPSVQRTLSGSLPGSSATIGHCKPSSSSSNSVPSATVIKKSKSVGNISSATNANGRRTPSACSTPSGTPKRNPSGVKTICVEITMERRKSLDRSSISSNASGGGRPSSASITSSRTVNNENSAPTRAKQKTDSLERSRVSSAVANSKTFSKIDATTGAVRPKSGILKNPSPKSERGLRNGTSGKMKGDHDILQKVHTRARSVEPAVRIKKTLSVREPSASPKCVHNGVRVKRSQSMERHNSKESADSYVAKQKQAWEEKSSTTVVTTVTEITRVHKKIKEPKINRKSVLVSQRHELFNASTEDKSTSTSPTKPAAKSPMKSQATSPHVTTKPSPVKAVHPPDKICTVVQTPAPEEIPSAQRALSPERVRSPDKPSLPEKPPGLRQSFKSRLAKEKAVNAHRQSSGNQSDDETYSRTNIVTKRNTTGTTPSPRPQSCFELTAHKKVKSPPPPPPRRDLPKEQITPGKTTHVQTTPVQITTPVSEQKVFADVPFIDEDNDEVFKAELSIQDEKGNIRYLSDLPATRPLVLQENVLKYPTQSNIISRYDEVDSAQNTSPTKENDVFHLSGKSTPLLDLDSETKWAIITRDLNEDEITKKNEIIVDNKQFEGKHGRTCDGNFEDKKLVEATNNNLASSTEMEWDKCGNEIIFKEEEKGGHYYLKIVNREHARIEEICQNVDKYLTDDVPEDASGKIRAAIGKANLLTSKKFKQFRGLCEQNITQCGDEAYCTTSTDLAGFWDMVMLQVEDVNHMFAEIEVLKKNGWASPVVIRAKHKQQLAGLEIMACVSCLLLCGDVAGYNAGTDTGAIAGLRLSAEEVGRLCPSSGRKRTTSSSTITPPPSPSPNSVTTPLKWSAAPPQPDPKAKAEREKKAAKARQSREEARRRLMAAKRAARQRAKSVDKNQETDAAVQIFIPETS